MKKLMKQRFLPPNYEQDQYTQYQNCRWGSRKTAEYIKEFHRLGARTNLMENKQHLISRFTGGLRMNLREKVKLQCLVYKKRIVGRFHIQKTLQHLRKLIKRLWQKRIKKQKRRKNRTTKKRQLKLIEGLEIPITDLSQEPAVGVDKPVIPQIHVLSVRQWQCKTVAVIDADEDVNQGSYEGGRKSRIN
ncbi:uncharacterized protein E5676_scaffold1970G00410 [Cucumis melo var. makuwa]|uniref:Retrotransposon gag domain-containing protein n=1 Tax=Cucumis melo var. makuwa TaxID=1194695 RepID=A0A5D3BAM5_CUCMM|nr:uncharacterized protein E5676_scaffold1970G00410 [Cucumis melo var. makuwa]